eukprot:gene2584-3232_t
MRISRSPSQERRAPPASMIGSRPHITKNARDKPPQPAMPQIAIAAPMPDLLEVERRNGKGWLENGQAMAIPLRQDTACHGQDEIRPTHQAGRNTP